MGRGGFEPPKALPPDLQSGPFGHLGTSPQDQFAGGPGVGRQTNTLAPRNSRSASPAGPISDRVEWPRQGETPGFGRNSCANGSSGASVPDGLKLRPPSTEPRPGRQNQRRI